MCCPGCQAVAEAIVDNGLEDYYHFRTSFAEQGEQQLESTLAHLKSYDHPEIQHDFVISDGNEKQIQLTIEGISCAACGWLIEKKLLSIPGIVRVAVNVAARRATISWQQDLVQLSHIIGQLDRIGYHALPFQPDEHEASFQKENKRFLRKLGLSGLMTMQVMMLAIALYFGIFGSIDEQTKTFFHWISLILATPVVLYSGSEFYRNALNGLRVRALNMNFSVSLAVLGTFFASAWATVTQSGEIYFESVCMFIFLLLISRYLEHRTRYKASQISANMLKYIPLSATLVENESVQHVLAKQLRVGQQVLVKPGETFPVDGVIVQGQGAIDESMLTGESESIIKQAKDDVFGGTLNLNGTFVVSVKHELKLSLVNNILRLQESALASKPKAAIYADRASQFFVIIVLVIALISYISWLQFQPDNAFWIAIAILVATCPCALSLATPSALTSAIAKLNEYGLLIKRADVLDLIPDVDTLVFDKTGTLTYGKFSISDIKLFNNYDRQHALKLAAALEQYSEHPIANAFTDTQPYKISEVSCDIGRGVTGVYAGSKVQIGHVKYIKSDIPELSSVADDCIVLTQANRLVATFAIKDRLREDAKQLIDSLKHKRIIMLSGDSQKNVEAIASKLAISDRLYRQLPHQKLDYIRGLQAQGAKVLMVGDGINDAPVLAAADVSVAMGGAADMSKRSADVVMLNPDLINLNQLFAMSIKVRKKIKQNMLWAIGYNLLILPLAIAGLLTPWMAVIGMSLSSIIVVTNSVRLLR
ncbi:heavy metal translocating P-type ATPase [Aliiglaciecola litoralis]|uniref:Heavy metal translocating P-type ATPase n=2 Tax=Aliiglaciecola litoralis TaxID=582857 RepID=A0ABP3WM63_9ALTE